MIPRLTLDIAWSDLWSALIGRPDAGAEERVLRQVPAGRSGVVCLSVRTALDALLRELALPAGAEVLMSAVNIQNMADIVRAHGLTVVPVDITLEGLAPTPEALGAAVTPQSRLFLLAHLFGSRVETEGLAEVCARHGLLFVEDCAQAFDGTLDASPGADVSLYSFGPIKTATALGGAVALFADADLAARVRQRVAAYPPMLSSWWRRRVLKHMALKAVSTPGLCGLVIGGLERLGRDPDAVIGSAARGFGKGDLLPQLRRRPPAALLTLLARRLATPPTAGIRARRMRAERIVRQLPASAVPGIGRQRHDWWLLPMLAFDPAKAVAHIRRQGFDATRGATSLRAMTLAPVAEQLVEQVVYLPVSSPLLSAQEDALAAAGRSFAATSGHAKEDWEPRATPWADLAAMDAPPAIAALIADIRRRDLDRSIYGALSELQSAFFLAIGRPPSVDEPGLDIAWTPGGDRFTFRYHRSARRRRHDWSAEYGADQVIPAFDRFIVRAGWVARAGHAPATPKDVLESMS